MKSEHYEELQGAISSAVIPDQMGSEAEYLAAGNTLKRYRWDRLWIAKQSNWICQNLYPYLNDDHIDTALRQMFNHRK